MVDWRELGKKALDVTKDVTEKGVDSFQEWKEDPTRIAKVEEKKALKQASKEIEKAQKKKKKAKKHKVNKKERETPSTSYYVIKHVGKATITLSEKAITIERSGNLDIHKGTNLIPYSKITSVQLRPATNFYAGYIHFNIPGSLPPKSGLTDAATDINSVMFSKKYNKQMEELRSIIEERILNLTPED